MIIPAVKPDLVSARANRVLVLPCTRPICAIAILLALLFGAAAKAESADGARSSGGGHEAPDGRIYDFYEAEMLTPFLKENNAGYAQELKPRLDDVRNKLQGFAADLEAAFKARIWLLVKGPLAQVAPLESSLQINNVPIAFQNEKRVGLSEDWLQSAPPLQQAGLLGHELTRYLFKQKGLGNEDDLREANRILFRAPKLTAVELSEELQSVGLTYLTRAEHQFAATIARSIQKQMVEAGCANFPKGKEWDRPKVQSAWREKVRPSFERLDTWGEELRLASQQPRLSPRALQIVEHLKLDIAWFVFPAYRKERPGSLPPEWSCTRAPKTDWAKLAE